MFWIPDWKNIYIHSFYTDLYSYFKYNFYYCVLNYFNLFKMVVTVIIFLKVVHYIVNCIILFGHFSVYYNKWFFYWQTINNNQEQDKYWDKDVTLYVLPNSITHSLWFYENFNNTHK